MNTKIKKTKESDASSGTESDIAKALASKLKEATVENLNSLGGGCSELYNKLGGKDANEKKIAVKLVEKEFGYDSVEVTSDTSSGNKVTVTCNAPSGSGQHNATVKIGSGGPQASGSSSQASAGVQEGKATVTVKKTAESKEITAKAEILIDIE